MNRAMVVTTAVLLALVAGTVAAQRRGEPVPGEVKAALLAPPQVPPAIVLDLRRHGAG